MGAPDEKRGRGGAKRRERECVHNRGKSSNEPNSCFRCSALITVIGGELPVALWWIASQIVRIVEPLWMLGRWLHQSVCRDERERPSPRQFICPWYKGWMLDDGGSMNFQ